MTGPVDPVEDVEPPVGAQREEVVAGDGLRLSGLAHHEQLEKNKHCISINITNSYKFSPDPDPAFNDAEDDRWEFQYTRTDNRKHSLAAVFRIRTF